MQKKQFKIKEKLSKFNIQISRELRDILHGYIMSDGHVYPEGDLSVEQSQKQEKFVQWMYEKLKPLRTDTPIHKQERFDKRTGKNTYSLRFNTRQLLQGYRSMWYQTITLPDGTQKQQKTLPKSIACFFSPTFITLWFAGDGTKETYYRAAKIEVTAFTEQERLLLQLLFKQKYDITTKINKAGFSKQKTQQWVLSIPANQYDKFRAIITKIDLIPQVFPNKLHKQQP